MECVVACADRRQDLTVRYHPTPISETAADIRESDNNTRTTSCSGNNSVP